MGELEVMKKDNNSARVEKAMSELEGLVTDFSASIANGTIDPEKFISISEIESRMMSLRKQTHEVYDNLLQTIVNEADEREIIRKKKLNTSRKE